MLVVTHQLGDDEQIVRHMRLFDTDVPLIRLLFALLFACRRDLGLWHTTKAGRLG